jgi:hypothetical protein
MAGNICLTRLLNETLYLLELSDGFKLVVMKAGLVTPMKMSKLRYPIKSL